jgi:hypothetical protein
MTAAAQLIKVFLSIISCKLLFVQLISNLSFLVCSPFHSSLVERAQSLCLRMLTLIRVSVPSQIYLVCEITFSCILASYFMDNPIF